MCRMEVGRSKWMIWMDRKLCGPRLKETQYQLRFSPDVPFPDFSWDFQTVVFCFPVPGLVDRISKGDVLVGPDVAKRLAMVSRCLKMSQVQVESSRAWTSTDQMLFVLGRKRIFDTPQDYGVTRRHFQIVVWHCALRFLNAIMPRQLRSSWLKWCESKTIRYNTQPQVICHSG